MKVESNIQQTVCEREMNYFLQFLEIIKYVKASCRIQPAELATDIEILKRLHLKFTFTQLRYDSNALALAKLFMIFYLFRQFLLRLLHLFQRLFTRFSHSAVSWLIIHFSNEQNAHYYNFVMI